MPLTAHDIRWVNGKAICPECGYANDIKDNCKHLYVWTTEGNKVAWLKHPKAETARKSA